MISRYCWCFKPLLLVLDLKSRLIQLARAQGGQLLQRVSQSSSHQANDLQLLRQGILLASLSEDARRFCHGAEDLI